MSAPTGGAPRRLVRSVVGALVTMLAGRDHADAMLGDLDEEAAARSGGALLRGFWYAREASSLVAGLVVERARGALGGAGAHWAGAGWDELRTAFRGIRRRPGGPALVALTMAVALTGVTTVFSLVHAAWLRDLPWDDDRALVRVFSAYGGLDGATSRTAVAPEVLRSVVDASPALVGAGAWTVGETVHFDTGEKTVRLDAPRVTHGLFGLLGVEAERGRLFTPEEETPGADAVVLLSDAFWRSAFGGDDDVVGRTMVLDGAAHRIVGVVPPAAAPVEPDVWRPLALGPEWYVDGRLGWEMLDVVGRLAPGTDAPAATRSLSEAFAARSPDRAQRLRQSVVAVPLREEMLGATGRVLLGLLAAAVLVVLVACANVATLLVARFEERARDIAVRRSLGATSGALARLALMESAVVCALGGAAGLALTQLALAGLTRSRIDLLAPLGRLQVSPAVVLFTLLAVGGTALVVGLAPAYRARRVEAQAVVREGGGRAHGTRTGAATRRTLVVVEIALALVLMSGVAVSLRSLHALTRVDPGFRPGGLVAARLEMPAGRLARERAAGWDRVTERVAAIPGVDAAGLVYALPLTGTAWSASFSLVDPDPDQAELEPGANMRPASPGYFQAAGLKVVRGRGLSEADGPDALPVVVVDETLGRRFWPGRSPVGRRVVLGVFLDRDTATVVGVVSDVRDQGLHAPDSGHMYFPVAQSPQRTMTLVARSTRDLPAMGPALREAVREVEPRMPVVSVERAEERVRAALAGPRVATLVLAGFGAVAALLAALGIFGVVGWTVRGRIREIGTRVALGAARRDVMALVLGQVGRLWVLGAALGVAGGAAAGATLDRIVPGGAAVEPWVLALTAAAMGVLALLAALVPVVRALAVDAAEALRGG